MEGKAVSSVMTPMSRRSREHRSSKNTGAIQEAPATQVDIASTPKIVKVGIACTTDAPKLLKELAGIPIARRPSRLFHKPNGFQPCEDLDEGNGTEVLLRDALTPPPATNRAKLSASSAGGSLGARTRGNGEAGQATPSGVPHAGRFTGSPAVLRSEATPEAGEQTNGRALRARHITPGKKPQKRGKNFQDVALGASDGARILGRRIKVFWPLDNKWFYGLVKAYNRGKRLHKIVYDDQDEEWVKLHEEQFKLQLREGETFGSQQPVLVKQSAAVLSINQKVGQVSGEPIRLATKERLDRDVNVKDLPASLLIHSSPQEPPEPHETSSVHRKSEVLQSDEDRQAVTISTEPGADVRADDKNLDLGSPGFAAPEEDDPYDIENSSISDSLETFRRFKQKVWESRKERNVVGAVLCSALSESAGLVAKSLEETCSVKASSCEEVKSSILTFNVACTSEDAEEVCIVSLSSEDCARKEGGACEKVFNEDEKSFMGSVGSQCLVGVNGCEATEPSDARLSGIGRDVESARSRDNSETFMVDDVELCERETLPLEASVQISDEEKHLIVEIREDVTISDSECRLEIGNIQLKPSVESVSCGKPSPSLWNEEPVKKSFSGRLGSGASLGMICYAPHDLWWLIRTGRFISQHVGTNLVSTSCAVVGQHCLPLLKDLGNIRECVPYLTVFISPRVKVGGSRSKSWRAYVTCCRKGQDTMGSMLQKNAGSGHGSSLMCPFPDSAASKPHLQGALLSSSNGAFFQRKFGSGVFSEGLAQLVVDNIPVLCMPPKDDITGLASAVHFTVNNPAEQPLLGDLPNFQALGNGEVVDHGEGESQTRCSVCGSGDAHSPGSYEGPHCRVCADGAFLRNAISLVESGNAGNSSEDPVESLEGIEHTLNAVHQCGSDCAGGCQVSELKGNVKILRKDESLVSELQENSSPSRVLDPLSIQVPPKDDHFDGLKELATADSLSVRGARTHVFRSGDFAKSWKSAKRGFSHIVEELDDDGLEAEDKSVLLHTRPLKQLKVQVENLSNDEHGPEDKENGGKEPPEVEMNGGKNAKSAGTRDSDSSLPRVNVLKLRRCPASKGVWRVAGNSGAPDRGVRHSSEGGKPLTPSSISDRKRPFRDCLEYYQPESPEENGHSTFVEGSFGNGLELSVLQGTEELKVKDIWSNCEVSSIRDVTSDSRKRLRTGSTSSASSDDAYVPHSRADDTYLNGAPRDHTYSESLCHGCIANVLIVQNDRGWRETGARIELQSNHGQGWMLLVSIRGENLHAYKAEQAIATGTTSRYTHAVVWKGARGWSLEFEDRKQWQVFKDLHEECFRRNARAASVRHIPIPGVKHIDDFAPRSPVCQFSRPYNRYVCRVEDEVEMALANNRVVYDMDSEDEEWLAQVNDERVNARGTRTRPLIAEETLERLIDKLEKDAFMHQQQQKGIELTSADDAVESCNGLATQEVIKVVYGHWFSKRMRKGMPLVRHFQPPPWEQYQKKVQMWEQEIAHLQQESPMASRQQLLQDCRKPPLFAFCLRPRGLEAQHKLLRQKSQRKQNLNGLASRHWPGFGSMESPLDSSVKRQSFAEGGNGLTPGPRRPGRPRLTEETVITDLAGSFNAIAREPSVLGLPLLQFEHRNLVSSEFGNRRGRKGKKVQGRKARHLRLLAAAQESRRKRLLLDNLSGDKLHGQPDVVVAAAIARNNAEAARARAQALYAVADAAMHKAVTAVITADALRAAEQRQAQEEETLTMGGDLERGPSFGSWRRAVPTADTGSLGVRESSGRQELASDNEDALLPVASWSQELGAGLGTHLLNKDSQMEGVGLDTAHEDSPVASAGLGRTRGESMMAMLTR